MRARVAAIALALALALAGCTTLLGIAGDYGTLDAGVGDDAAADDAAADAAADSPNFDVSPLDAPSCGMGRVCLPAPPPGWTGPVELYDGVGPAPPCAAPFPTDVVTANRSLNAPPAMCSCACGPTADVTCGPFPVS